jgi:hypothetical protein
MKRLFEALGVVPSGTGLPDADLQEIVRQRQLYGSLQKTVPRQFSGDGMGIDGDAFDLPMPLGNPSPAKAAGKPGEAAPKSPSRRAGERTPLDAPAQPGGGSAPPEPAAPPEPPEPDGFDTPEMADLEEGGGWAGRDFFAMPIRGEGKDERSPGLGALGHDPLEVEDEEDEENSKAEKEPEAE